MTREGFRLFFLSGASGLVYELLWVRMIDKVTGLAIGSFFISRVIDSICTMKQPGIDNYAASL